MSIFIRRSNNDADDVSDDVSGNRNHMGPNLQNFVR